MGGLLLLLLRRAELLLVARGAAEPVRARGPGRLASLTAPDALRPGVVELLRALRDPARVADVRAGLPLDRPQVRAVELLALDALDPGVALLLVAELARAGVADDARALDDAELARLRRGACLLYTSPSPRD